jgi:hypothetical protein
MQKMLGICSSFAADHDMVFNSKKTVLMCVKPRRFKKLIVPNICLNGKVLNLVNKHKYLGVLNDKFNDDDDLRRQTRSIYSRGNVIVKWFKQCNDEVKSQLFKSYCSNFYCSQLWSEQKYLVSTIRTVNVAFKRIFRALFGIKRESIAAKMLQLNCNPFNVIQRKLIYSFKERIEKSENVLVKTINGCEDLW